MATNYPEELGKWVKRRNSKEPLTPVARFLAVRDDIEAAIEAGYPMKTICRQMKEGGRLVVHYDTFRSYVKKYILEANQSNAAVTPMKSTTAIQKPTQATSPPVIAKTAAASPGGIPGFTFNPHPNKEDLI